MALKIHHLNCGSMCPVGRRLINGDGGLLSVAQICCHCLLIEGRDGLVLVDTGLGTADVADPSRLGALFRHVTRPRLLAEETALHQLRALGFEARDVRHIVLTHLDLDHAGGLADFPDAQVHVYATEQRAAMNRATANERGRYRPAQFAHGPKWVTHQLVGERWFGFDSVRALPDATEEILLVPLIGHTRGHCGVAVRAGEGWLLHCGDAYFFHAEVDPAAPYCTPGLRLFQNIMQLDGSQRRANQARLRQLAATHGGEVRLFCAHDVQELARLR
jgi:glyoxylase-like metal-dependent hydrolase (beta-lactamase superfamily II)